MKKLLQTIVASILLVTFILGIQPEFVSASYYPQPEFVVDTSGKLVKYNGLGGNIIIPDNVTEIGAGVFNGNRDIISVTMSDQVTHIGKGAFESCYNITSVKFSNKLTVIDDNAFWGCTSLTSLNLPTSLTEIGMCAFMNVTSVETIYIPKNVSSIGSYAFGFLYQANYDPLPNIIILSDGNQAASDYASKYGFAYATKKNLQTKITSAKRTSAHKISVKWKENKMVKGYQVEYSTNKKFTTSTTKVITVNADNTSKTIKCKKGKKYYIRIRGYQMSGNTYYFSSWNRGISVK